MNSNKQQQPFSYDTLFRSLRLNARSITLSKDELQAEIFVPTSLGPGPVVEDFSHMLPTVRFHYTYDPFTETLVWRVPYRELVRHAFAFSSYWLSQKNAHYTSRRVHETYYPEKPSLIKKAIRDAGN